MMGDWVRFGAGRFTRTSSEDGLVQQVLQQALLWQQTQGALLAVVPPFLRERVRAVMVRDDGTLVWHAVDNAAAARLRMMLPTLLPQWQKVDKGIAAATVKIRLPEGTCEKVKQAHVSKKAAQGLRQTADTVVGHPKLAAALRRLADKADDEAG